MIRRFALALATVALAGTGTTGCSTVTSARNAATVDGHHLSVKRFEALLAGLAQAPDAFGIPPVGATGMPGKTARSILGQWISNTVMANALAKKGVTVSVADRKAAEDKIASGNAATIWATFSPDMRAFVIDAQTLQPAFQQAFGTEASKALSNAASVAKINVDSHDGMWDAATGQVVATR